ncbi:MAG TPA: cytochrome P450 [Quisquiliibacterium sp.]|nr:cytochrome P450 [Quisquiliibacterium sp.]HPA89630.1 cytochrome P450 [Quisquiliibacterium sp.]HQN12489.1 cytochrome P450 [Quisquiliibacterium sp.]
MTTTTTGTEPARAPAAAAARLDAVRTVADLPSPKGVPLLGNMLQIKPDSMHRILEGWARDLGPIYRVDIGRRRSFLVVSDHEIFSTALRDRPEGYRRPPLSGELVREMGFDVGVFSANGDKWRRQRRMVMAGFDPRHLKAYFPALVHVTERFHGRWDRAARAGLDIDLQADLMRYTVDTIAGLAFGADVNTLESDDDVIQRHIDQIFPILWKRILAPFPMWRYYKTAADRRLDRSVHAVKDAIDGFIAQARARLQADPSLREHPNNLLEAMIAAADQGDSGLDDHDVAGNVLTMLLAGEDTTANTLAWMIHLLHANPETLARARDEVLRVTGTTGPFTLEQMSALDYVEACAHETMRLKPVAPLQAVESVTETMLGDVRIPAGTRIFGTVRHDSLLARYFPDPETFLPERWLADGHPGQAASSAKRVSMPFGAGPRMCPGRNLALLEMKMAMAMLLRHFDIERVATVDGGPVRELLAFTMAPYGLRMRLRVRD